jgi:hypothetical protein
VVIELLDNILIMIRRASDLQTYFSRTLLAK